MYFTLVVLLLFGTMAMGAQPDMCTGLYEQCYSNRDCCTQICNGVYKRCVSQPQGYKPQVTIGPDAYLIWHKQKLTWSGAKDFCEERGFHLLSLEKKRKFKTLSAYLHNEGFLVGGLFPPTYWTSGNSINTPGEFVWEQSEKPIYSGLWERQPHKTHRRKCVTYSFKDPGSVHNTDCAHKHYFICERPEGVERSPREGNNEQGYNRGSDYENDDTETDDNIKQNNEAPKKRLQSDVDTKQGQQAKAQRLPTYHSFGFDQNDNPESNEDQSASVEKAGVQNPDKDAEKGDDQQYSVTLDDIIYPTDIENEQDSVREDGQQDPAKVELGPRKLDDQQDAAGVGVQQDPPHLYDVRNQQDAAKLGSQHTEDDNEEKQKLDDDQKDGQQAGDTQKVQESDVTLKYKDDEEDTPKEQESDSKLKNKDDEEDTPKEQESDPNLKNSDDEEKTPKGQQLDRTRKDGQQDEKQEANQDAEQKQQQDSVEGNGEKQSRNCKPKGCGSKTKPPTIQDNKKLSIQNVTNVQISNVNSISKIGGSRINNIGNSHTSSIHNILSNSFSQSRSLNLNVHNDTGGLRLLNIPHIKLTNNLLDNSHKFIHGVCGGFPCPHHMARN